MHENVGNGPHRSRLAEERPCLQGAQFRPEPEGGEIPSENDYRENHFPKVFLFVCFSRKRNKLDDLISISSYTEHVFRFQKE